MDTYRIESEMEVNAYLANLRYALDKGARISVQMERKVDENREKIYTNKYAIAKLFPNSDTREVLKNELLTLTVNEYMRTVKDNRFPERSEMREFGKVYNGTDDVYMKIRAELLTKEGFGQHTVFVMSFHLSTIPFEKEMFPYRKGE